MVLLALSILSGRIALSRIIPVNSELGSVEVANCLLFGALFIASGLLFLGQLKVRFSARPTIILIALLFFFISIVTIDALAYRSSDIPLLQEVGRIFLTVAGVSLFLDGARRFNQFLGILIVVGLTITLGDLAGWRLQRLQLITGLSTSRINLFVLGAAATLYISTRRVLWLPAILIAVFALLSGSMKISMLSGVTSAFIVVVVLLAAYRFVDTARISIAVLAGITFSILTGDIDNTLSRVEVVNMAAGANSMPLANADPEAVAMCAGTQDPLYCVTPFVVMGDSTERLRLFSHAITLIKTAPLLGPGPDTFKLSLWYKAGGKTSLNVYVYPHNLLLDIGVTHGIVGVACLLVLLAICLIVILSTFANSLASVGLLAAAASVLVAALTGGDFYDSRYIYICAMLAALGSFDSVQKRSDAS
jgi:hypothetical protein